MEHETIMIDHCLSLRSHLDIILRIEPGTLARIWVTTFLVLCGGALGRLLLSLVVVHGQRC